MIFDIICICINILCYLHIMKIEIIILLIIVILIECICDIILRMIAVVKSKLIRSFDMYMDVICVIGGGSVIGGMFGGIGKEIIVNGMFVVCGVAAIKNGLSVVRLWREKKEDMRKRKKIVQIIRFDSEIPENNKKE